MTIPSRYRTQYDDTRKSINAYLSNTISLDDMLTQVLTPMYDSFKAVKGKQSIDGLWLPIGNAIYRLIPRIPKEVRMQLVLCLPLSIGPDDPPWMVEGQLLSLARWHGLWKSKTTKTQRKKRCPLKLNTLKTTILERELHHE